jgi:hypothetical protein
MRAGHRADGFRAMDRGQTQHAHADSAYPALKAASRLHSLAGGQLFAPCFGLLAGRLATPLTDGIRSNTLNPDMGTHLLGNLC